MTATVLSMFAGALLMQGGLAVRSSAWLGVLLWVMWLVAVGFCIRGGMYVNEARKILLPHHHNDLDGSQNDKDNRETVKPICDLEHGDGVVLNSLTGDLSPLGKGNLKLGDVSLQLNRVRFFSNQLLKVINPFIHPLGIELVLKRAHTPNDKSSATDAGRKR